MAFTVIWYGKAGIVAKTPFDAQKAARDNALQEFAARKLDDGIVAVQVRNDSGDVVFSHAGGSNSQRI